MAKGHRYTVHAYQGTSADGWRVDRYALDARLNYVPYFYNPALAPDGQRLLFISDRAGTEQAYILDCDTCEAVQLTCARGRNQTWAPYIREPVAGVRPQFVCWSRPDWSHVLFWDADELRRVHVGTLAEEALYALPPGRVPSAPHCSEGGLVCFGWLPETSQNAMLTRSVEDTEEELLHGCGFVVLDTVRRRIVAEVETPFWANHVAASADGRRVLHCHEGSWRRQRMHVYELQTGVCRPLRPQSDGAAIGHEFWIDARRVGYHGDVGGRSVFGLADVETGTWEERPSAHDRRHAAHCHASPDAAWLVTDGEATADCISIARIAADTLHFEPVCRHDWARHRDQRYHPHPHWHPGPTAGRRGAAITFTACDQADQGVSTSVALLTQAGT